MPNLTDLPAEILLLILLHVDSSCLGRHGLEIFNLSYVNRQFYHLVLEKFRWDDCMSWKSGARGASIEAFRTAEAYAVLNSHIRGLACNKLSDEEVLRAIREADGFERTAAVSREILRLTGKYQMSRDRFGGFGMLKQLLLGQSWKMIMVLLA